MKGFHFYFPRQRFQEFLVKECRALEAFGRHLSAFLWEVVSRSPVSLAQDIQAWFSMKEVINIDCAKDVDITGADTTFIN